MCAARARAQSHTASSNLFRNARTRRLVRAAHGHSNTCTHTHERIRSDEIFHKLVGPRTPTSASGAAVTRTRIAPSVSGYIEAICNSWKPQTIQHTHTHGDTQPARRCFRVRRRPKTPHHHHRINSSGGSSSSLGTVGHSQLRLPNYQYPHVVLASHRRTRKPYA